MTITFPRDFPSDTVFAPGCTFEPSYQQVRAPTRGGGTQVANIGPDLWAMSYQTVPLSLEQGMIWHAWLQSLRGGARLFKAWHPLCRYALAYRTAGYGGLTRAGGGAFDGTATLSAIATERDVVTITGLPAGFVFSVGDMISVPFASTGRALLRVVEAATASGAGSATPGVEPFVPLAVATGVTVDLTRPWCNAVLDADSVQGPWQLGRRAAVRFSALQVY